MIIFEAAHHMVKKLFVEIVRLQLRSRKTFFQEGAHLIKNKKYSTKRFSRHLEMVL